MKNAGTRLVIFALFVAFSLSFQPLPSIAHGDAGNFDGWGGAVHPSGVTERSVPPEVAGGSEKCCPSATADGTDTFRQNADFSELEKTVAAEMRERQVPGVAVAVVSGDQIVFAKGFGTASVETGAPVTTDTLFRLGSSTKMFTAAACLTLVEQGKLKLDEPVVKVADGLDPKLGQLTLHQLLSHTAGLIDDAPMYGPHDESAMAESVRSWKADRLFTEPGEVISYANPGYVLAGHVLAKAGGKPFSEVMDERIFKPLGMTRTTFQPTTAMTYPLAQGHDRDAQGNPRVVRPLADNAAAWPPGSIFSSVEDLSRFAIAFLNGGKLDGKQVLSPWVIETMSKPRADIPGSAGAKYGYGLMTGTYRGLRIVEHGGARTGYGAVVKMIPERRFGVVVLANRSGAMLNETARKALELVIKELAPDTSKPASELPATERDITDAVGTYVHGPLRFEISAKDGRLLFNRGGRAAPLIKIGENRHAIGAIGGEELNLIAGRDGKIKYLHLSLRAAVKVSENRN